MNKSNLITKGKRSNFFVRQYGKVGQVGTRGKMGHSIFLSNDSSLAINIFAMKVLLSHGYLIGYAT